MPTQAQMDAVARTRAAVERYRAHQAKNWLADTYAKRLYGGWRHPDGRIIEKPHSPIIEMHETCKALFCPYCTRCGQTKCSCEPVVHCRHPIGFVGTEEDDEFVCPEHGPIKMRDAWAYPSIYMTYGNRSGKDHGGMSEFVAWIKGYRPWDGTLTAPRGHGRWWIMTARANSAADSIIVPYFEERAADIILGVEKGNQGQVKHWIVRSSDGGEDKVALRVNEQYLRMTQGNNPFEGQTWFGAYESEPLARGARVSITRGLVTTRAIGWGREIIAATPIYDNYMFDLYQKADKIGEPNGSSMIALHGNMDDNPSLTAADIQAYMEDLEPEEREARRYGRFMSRAGRVWKGFSEFVHVFTDNMYVDADGRPSQWPGFSVIDPADAKACTIAWGLVAPDGSLYFTHEWPEGGVHGASGAMDFDRLAEIHWVQEDGLPGGRERFVHRVMDPNFGRSSKAGLLGTVQEEFENRGIFYDTDVSDDIAAGHGRVRTMLAYDENKPLGPGNRPRIFIHERCRGLIKACLRYAYRQKTLSDGTIVEVLDERYKDSADLIRYAAMADLPFVEWKDGMAGWYERQIEERERALEIEEDGW